MVKNINGLILIDAPHSALNNAGTDSSERTENITRVKAIRKGRNVYPYVSGQAFRNWWRETLREKFDWKLSPIVREKKIAFTEANPIDYPDDDIFGYMRAPKGKGSEVSTRLSVLKTSPLISVFSQRPNEDFAVMARQDGDPVPYESEFYSTVLKGIFSLDLDRAGVFTDYNRSGYKNFNSEILKKAQGIFNKINNDYKLIKNERVKRVQDVIRSLHLLQGGAKLTTNLTDVAPKFIILTVLNSGNHILMNVIEELESDFAINFDALKRVLLEYKDLLLSNVYIGRRAGFLDKCEKEIKDFVEDMKREGIEVNYCIDIKKTLNDFSEVIPDLIE